MATRRIVSIMIAFCLAVNQFANAQSPTPQTPVATSGQAGQPQQDIEKQLQEAKEKYEKDQSQVKKDVDAANQKIAEFQKKLETIKAEDIAAKIDALNSLIAASNIRLTKLEESNKNSYVYQITVDELRYSAAKDALISMLEKASTLKEIIDARATLLKYAALSNPTAIYPGIKESLEKIKAETEKPIGLPDAWLQNPYVNIANMVFSYVLSKKGSRDKVKQDADKVLFLAGVASKLNGDSEILISQNTELNQRIQAFITEASASFSDFTKAAKYEISWAKYNECTSCEREFKEQITKVFGALKANPTVLIGQVESELSKTKLATESARNLLTQYDACVNGYTLLLSRFTSILEDRKKELEKVTDAQIKPIAEECKTKLQEVIDLSKGNSASAKDSYVKPLQRLKGNLIVAF